MAKIKGMSKAKAELIKLEARVKAAAKKAELEVANLIANDAKARVHVRSGYLKNSIGIEQNETSTAVVVNASYSGYEEFGTGPLTVIPEGFDEEARKFFISGRGNQMPHPFFYPAVFAHRDKLIPIIEKELNDTQPK